MAHVCTWFRNFFFSACVGFRVTQMEFLALSNSILDLGGKVNCYSREKKKKLDMYYQLD